MNQINHNLTVISVRYFPANISHKFPLFLLIVVFGSGSKTPVGKRILFIIDMSLRVSIALSARPFSIWYRADSGNHKHRIPARNVGRLEMARSHRQLDHCIMVIASPTLKYISRVVFVKSIYYIDYKLPLKKFRSARKKGARVPIWLSLLLAKTQRKVWMSGPIHRCRNQQDRALSQAICSLVPAN